LVRRSLREGWVEVKPLLIATALAIVLTVPVLGGLHAVSRWVT